MTWVLELHSRAYLAIFLTKVGTALAKIRSQACYPHTPARGQGPLNRVMPLPQANAASTLGQEK